MFAKFCKLFTLVSPYKSYNSKCSTSMHWSLVGVLLFVSNFINCIKTNYLLVVSLTEASL